jgi:hypothetical protein
VGAVTGHHVASPDLLAVGQPHRHALVVLIDVHDRGPVPDLGAERHRMVLEQLDDDRLGDAEQVGVRRGEGRGRRCGDGGEEGAGRTGSPVLGHDVQEATHGEQLEAADVQSDDADERRRLGLLLHDEHADVVEAELGGHHRAGRTAADDDHVEHRRSRRGVHEELSFGRAWWGAPGDGYIDRRTVTERGSTHIAWIMGPTSSGNVAVAEDGTSPIGRRAPGLRAPGSILAPPPDAVARRAGGAVRHEPNVTVVVAECSWSPGRSSAYPRSRTVRRHATTAGQSSP